MKPEEVRAFLDQKANQYNTPKYIETDPIQIPHRFDNVEDIEISAFLTSLITWGNRKAIIHKASIWMDLMDNSPHQWIMTLTPQKINRLNSFYYRTLNQEDTKYIINRIHQIITEHQTLGKFFEHLYRSSNNQVREMLSNFYQEFTCSFPQRTKRHIANINSGSAAKRLNMFLRWMVREDHRGVDFGLWKFISPAELYLPLDVHSGRISRKLGLLNIKNNNWKAVEEITSVLRTFNPNDPVIYDFALFGLGIFEKF